MSAPGSPHLELFYFDAGGGHRSAATALQQVITERFPGWRVEPVNLQEVLSGVDPLASLTRRLRSAGLLRPETEFRSEDLYNALLARGWTYGSSALLRCLQKGIGALAPHMEDVLARRWREDRPDLVVSLVPNFNRVLFRALRRAHPGLPYVTVMTDLADCPPHFWQEAQDQFMVCGSAMAVRQARAIGYRPERIFRVSGMILRPQFYRREALDRRAAREAIGLDADLPTALVMFGGTGAKVSADIVRHLEGSGMALQSIVMCGRNAKLREALRAHASCRAVGFTDRVPAYMQMADFFIGKPGPGSLSEALHMGLPVIAERNRATLAQERYNTEWIEQQALGLAVRDFKRKETLRAIRSLLEGRALARFRESARRLENRAVFEIRDILARILADAHCSAGRSAPRPSSSREPRRCA